MEIVLEKFDNLEIIELLEEHHREMRRHSPPESIHALDLTGLKSPEITFWSVRDGSELLGCVAMKELTSRTGEIKSMRVADKHQGKGIANFIMMHILDVAQSRGYRQLSLETGSMAGFSRARALYRKFGFRQSGPFADYTADPNSVFMTKYLA